MADTHLARCECGLVTATVSRLSPGTCNHAFCYCEDCQAFAHFLGGVERILDPEGGSEIIQVSAGRVEFHSGKDQLRMMRLSENGLSRWYTACCRTPIANTIGGAWLPFVSLINPFFPGKAPDAATLAAIGPVRARGFIQSAKGTRGRTNKRHEGLMALMTRFGKIVLMGRLAGEARRHPLFHPETKAPISAPRILTLEEREDLRVKVAG